MSNSDPGNPAPADASASAASAGSAPAIPVAPAVPVALTRRAHDRRRYPRLARELATIRAMVNIYCRDHHGRREELCAECRELMTYATRRLDRCVFGDDKPTCANCTVHCYNAAMREQVRIVMRYAGPRMIWRHPILAIRHILDGKRAAPPGPVSAPPRRAAAETRQEGTPRRED